MMKNIVNVAHSTSTRLHWLREADIQVYMKTRLTSRIIRSDTRNQLVLSNSWGDRSLSHLCVLSHDDVTTMQHDTLRQYAHTKKAMPNSLRFCCWPPGIYSYIKIYAFLVIWWWHLSPATIAVFRLGKNCREVSKWRLACTPVSFYIVRRAQSQA